MKYALTLCLAMLTSCGYVPQMLQEAENIADDDAVKVTVSREAIQRNTNLRATIELDNGQIQTQTK